MTFSILAYDEKTDSFGGAAATGSLCVGGWVLRGDPESGLSASQGTSPSTLWGTQVLELMREGLSAGHAVTQVTGGDPGSPDRQLAALDPTGSVAAFTGDRSVPHALSLLRPGAVVAGNMLAGPGVLEAMHDAFEQSDAPLAERLIAALKAAQASGGDNRGLLSAALLVVSRRQAPLTLRIDWSETPLEALDALYARSQAEPYRSWTTQVPTLDEPFRDWADTGVPTRR